MCGDVFAESYADILVQTTSASRLELLERVEAQAKSSSSDSATNQDVVGQESGGDWEEITILVDAVEKVLQSSISFSKCGGCTHTHAEEW